MSGNECVFDMTPTHTVSTSTHKRQSSIKTEIPQEDKWGV